jgi:hypothetical protein
LGEQNLAAIAEELALRLGHQFVCEFGTEYRDGVGMAFKGRIAKERRDALVQDLAKQHDYEPVEHSCGLGTPGLGHAMAVKEAIGERVYDAVNGTGPLLIAEGGAIRMPRCVPSEPTAPFAGTLPLRGTCRGANGAQEGR